MSDYLLDTNHASPLITPKHPLRQWVLQHLDAGDTFAVCVPVLTETLFGIGILPRAVENRAEWARLQPSLPCYIPDEIDADGMRFQVWVGGASPGERSRDLGAAEMASARFSVQGNLGGIPSS